MNPRKDLVDATETELRKNGWAYMKAPTGAGKTWMAFDLGSRFPGVKVYLSPSRQLVDQTRADAKAKGLDSWFFATWQKAKNLTDLGLTGVALVIIDEIHVGGVGEGKSIRLALENLNPRHVVYVSATPEPVNAGIFGSQNESMAALSHEDAVSHGLILPIRWLAVTDKKVFSMGVREQAIADHLSLSIERLHETVVGGLGVFAEEIESIRARRRDILLQAVLKRESSFVYFAENLEEAEKTAAILTEKQVSAVIVSGSSSKAENDQALSLFAQGKVMVIIACRMLREGWNLPQLEAVVDAAFSPTTIHHAMQKAGRTARPFGDKKEGRYYYCLSEQARRRKNRLSRLELIREEEDDMRSRAVIDAILLTGFRPKLEVTEADEIILSHVLGSGEKCNTEFEIHEQHASATGAIALLRLAASGAPKPKNRSSLGCLLKTIRSNPDNSTHQKLKVIRPEWLEIQEKAEVIAEKRWMEMINKFERSELSKADIVYLRNAYGHSWGKHGNFQRFMSEHKPELLAFVTSIRKPQQKQIAERYVSIKAKLSKKQPLDDLEKKALRSWRGKKTKTWYKLLELGLVKEN